MCHPKFASDPKEAIIEGFKATNDHYTNLAVKLSDKSGSTATALIIIGSTLFCANVGDSSAMLSRGPGTILQVEVNDSVHN